MVYGLRDGIFLRLNYHIVLCIDLFLTSHGEGNFWQICRLFQVFCDAKQNIIIIYYSLNIFVDSYRSKQQC